MVTVLEIGVYSAIAFLFTPKIPYHRTLAALVVLLSILFTPEAPYPRALRVKIAPPENCPVISPIPDGALDVSSIAERWFVDETFGAGRFRSDPLPSIRNLHMSHRLMFITLFWL
jgi:hypothetical protein